jgi:hypothetical protein
MRHAGSFPRFFSLGLQQSTIPSICRESRNNKMSRTRLDMEPRITSFFQRCADAQVDLIEWDHPLLARLNYPLVVDKASGTSFFSVHVLLIRIDTGLHIPRTRSCSSQRYGCCYRVRPSRRRRRPQARILFRVLQQRQTVSPRRCDFRVPSPTSPRPRATVMEWHLDW